MYVTIQERIEAAGWGGQVEINGGLYTVVSYEVGGAHLVHAAKDEKYFIVLTFTDQARAYVYENCDICGRPQYFRWSLASHDVMRKVMYCQTCYDRMRKRKQAFRKRMPDQFRVVVGQSRLPALEIVRIAFGDELYTRIPDAPVREYVIDGWGIYDEYEGPVRLRVNARTESEAFAIARQRAVENGGEVRELLTAHTRAPYTT